MLNTATDYQTRRDLESSHPDALVYLIPLARWQWQEAITNARRIEAKASRLIQWCGVAAAVVAFGGRIALDPLWVALVVAFHCLAMVFGAIAQLPKSYPHIPDPADIASNIAIDGDYPFRLLLLQRLKESTEEIRNGQKATALWFQRAVITWIIALCLLAIGLTTPLLPVLD
ncbi:MAG: hypothetical protein QXZ09_06790 [Candidatus Methanomethylicaceae archaeon]